MCDLDEFNANIEIDAQAQCCNPEHLEALSRQEHRLRHNHPQDAPDCKHGHIRTPENTYITPKGKMACKDCGKASKERWPETKWRAQHPRR